MLLKDCCNFQEGYVNPDRTKSEYFTNGTINWLKATDIKNNFIYGTEDKINKVGLSSCGNQTIFPCDSIVLSKSGTVGNIGILKCNVYGNRATINIIPNEEKVNPMFIYYLLSARKEELKARAVGSIQKNLYISCLEPVDIGDFDRNTQDKIAEILSEIDEQINRNNEVVKKLQVLAQTTYSRWFNQFEFPNEDGLPYKSNCGQMVWNDELKQEVPDGWQIKSIGDLLTEEDKSKVQVGEAKINGGVFPFFTSGEEILLYKDSFVDGPHCYLNTGGNADVKFFDGKASYSTDTWCIAFNEYTYFINELLQSIKPQIDKLYFSGSGLKHLQKESFKQLKLFVPDEKTLDKYNAVVSGCYQQIANIYIENNRLQSLKNNILPLLINGQLKL